MKEMSKINTSAYGLLDLLAMVERDAIVNTDGHFTIYRFTTGWKVVLGTAALDSHDRETLSAMPIHTKLGNALAYAIKHEPSMYPTGGGDQ